MPKRSIHVQPSSDNPCRRTRRDHEFLCNYLDRLLAPNQSYDIRLPELSRADRLTRHVSAVPLNNGLRINVSFVISNDTDSTEAANMYVETCCMLHEILYNAPPYHTELHNCGSRCNSAIRNNLYRDYQRRMSENYAAAIERELIKARVLTLLIERDRIAGRQSAFYNQRTTTNNWNKYPVGNRTSSGRVSSGLQGRHVNPRERNDCQACASFSHECCANDRTSKDIKQGCSTSRQSARQKESSSELNDLPKTSNQYYRQSSLRTSLTGATLKKMQPDNALQNRGTALHRNDNVMKRNSKESMETCQGVSKTIVSAAKAPHSIGSRVKPDGVAINNDERSIDPRQPGCQGNLSRAGSIVVTDQGRHVEGQGHGGKRKLDDLEDRATAADLNRVGQGPLRATGRIEPRVKDAPTTFTSNENATKAARSRIRNGRSSTRKHPSYPKYASFLRMFCKEEADERWKRGNSSSEKNEGEKSQRRGGISTKSAEHDTRAIRDGPQIERRTPPIPRSTVHTTYNPITHSSASDPISDSNGLTTQLLRLAVLLYAPALMPAMNSLIAQRNHQISVSTPSFEGSNDTLTQIFRLLNEQQTIPNLPFVSIGPERDSSILTAETNIGNSSISPEERKDSSIATGESSVSRQESISGGTSDWKSNDRAQPNAKERKWRLTSMLDSGVRLDRNVLDLRTAKRPENIRSLSTRSKNEIVMKKCFQNWLRQLLRHLDARGTASDDLSSNNEETGCPEGSSWATNGEPSLRDMERQRSADHLVSDESPDSSKDDGNILTEHEEEDSDDQKSVVSVTSTNSSRSLRLKQEDASIAKRENS